MIQSMIQMRKNIMSRQANSLDNAPMEPLFSSLKSEWVPGIGYCYYTQAAQEIINYIVGYYSQVRPHQHNRGLAPNRAKEVFNSSSKIVVLDHYRA